LSGSVGVWEGGKSKTKIERISEKFCYSKIDN